MLKISGRTILLVEDEVILAMAEKMALEKYGYVVRTVPSGEKAVEMIKKSSEIDLILMDINLGDGLDGTETAEIILKDYDIPVVFVSSHTEPEIVEKTEKITSYGYVVKNSSVTVLDASIKMAFKLFDANKSIKNSESKQKTMISNISDVIGIIDVAGYIKYTSPNIEKWFGWVPEDLVGTDGWLTVHPDDLERVQNIFSALLNKNNSTSTIEYRYKCNDGRYKPIELTAINLVNDPSIDGILMNFHDMSERKHANELMTKSEKRYRTLFESMPIGVFYFNPEGMIQFANAAAEDILGISMDKIITRIHTDNRWQNIHEDGSEFGADFLPSSVAMRTGKAVRNVTIGIFNQRETAYRWVRGSAIPQFHEGETSPYQVYVTMEDITESKKAVQFLRDNEKRIANAEKIARIGNWTLQVETKSMVASNGANTIYGTDIQKTTFDDLQLIPLPEYRPLLDKALSDLVNHNIPYDLEYKIRRPLDGTIRDIHSVATFDKHDNSVLGVIQDITEWKSMGELLKKSEEQHRFLVKNNHDIIYTLTSTGILTFVSPAWTLLLGHAVDQVIGKSFEQFVHADDMADCLAWLKKVIETGKRQHGIEYRVKHIDGRWLWHTSSAVPIRNESGKVIGFEGTATDITERKMMEESLRKIRENYETFFNSIDEFLFVLDERGNIIHVNSTVIDRLGYSQNELYGKPVLMLHPSDRREEAEKIIIRMLNGTADFCPVPITSKAGVQIPVETRVTHGIWDEKPVLFGISKDSSRLHMSEEKFSKIFHINPSACGLSDIESHKYVEVNDAFYSLLGFKKEEVIGSTPDVLGILSPEMTNTVMQKADSNGKVTNADAILKTKNGDIKHVLLSAETINVQDKKYRFTIVNDITEQKLSEAKINTLLSEKELILKEVHHRIKNNMNTISSLLSLHAETVKDPSAVIALHDAKNRIQSMSLLYDKLYRSVDFSSLSIKDYLSPLVDEVVKNFPNSQIVAIEKNIIDFSLDVKRLQSIGIIINELITNIMKYAFTGREHGNILFSVLCDDGHVIITVQDDGTGIPASISFENPTGFGLQLVQTLTQQLNGTVRFERDHGTKVLIEFNK